MPALPFYGYDLFVNASLILGSATPTRCVRLIAAIMSRKQINTDSFTVTTARYERALRDSFALANHNAVKINISV
jgi:hypothetical protein